MELKILTSLKRYISIYFLVLILVLPLFEPGIACCQAELYASSSQENELKRDSVVKYIRNYNRKEYNNKSQNWVILQDKRGLIYVANQGGLLEFDGVSWREIRVPNITVRSLAMDDKGNIYVGGIDEIGFLAPDPKGVLKYISLTERLDNEYRSFSCVWRTHATKEGIYFCTSKFLFLWDFKKIMCKAKADSYFAVPFLCKGELYVRQHGVGLLKIKAGSLELIPGGEAFSSRSIYVLVEYEPGKLLIGAGSEGFYLYEKGNVTPFETDALNYIKNNELRYCLRLSSGDFALATFKGVIIIDRQGRLITVFNKNSGLQAEDVNYIFEDFQGNLWLCLAEGISRIEYGAPISVYDDRYDLPGNVLSVVRHQGKLYTGTTMGLYFFDSSSSFPDPGKFRPVPGIPGYCWSLLSTTDLLLAATDKGVFQVGKDNIKKNITSRQSFTLYRSQKDTNRIWVGTHLGLISLFFQRKNNQWTEEYKFEDINQRIITIVEDKKGNLWLGTRTKGVLYIAFPSEGKMTHPDITTYDSSHGLPTGEVNVFMAAGHVVFATGKGIFRFDEKIKCFLPDDTLGPEFTGSENGRGVFRIVEDKKKNTWLHSRSRNIQAIPQSDGTFLLNKKPFLRIPLVQVNAIYPDPDRETIWFASADGLIGYNTNMKKNYDLPFQTLVREVEVNGTPLIYDAKEFKYKNSTGDYWKGNSLVFPYKDRNLRFQFAAPFFEGETETMYQYFLKGYDNDWSAWTKEIKKDYTNLGPGLHLFRVRARNVYGNISSEAAFQFKVLPPWYQTWWAFLVYAVTAVIVMFSVVRWRSWKLVREKQKLEQIIKERTEKINHQKQQLQEQAEKLKEMDKVKSRFFANISHEFRTPITLIMGPLEQMLSTCPEHDREQKKKLRMMLRNCQRLLRLINQLLELANFESGTMKLQSRPRNIIHFLKGIIASFEMLTDQEELDLIFYAEEEDITLYLDERKMEDVICNLLTNAIKFTPAGGKIAVTCTRNPTKKVNFPSGSVKISVSDTGPGIPGEKLAGIFDRFYQSESTYEHYHQGFGIGLAIAKELVELHHGSINVHSTEGQGTEFIIELPLGDQHLKPDQIIDLTEESVSPPGPGEIPIPNMAKAEKEEEPEEEMEQEITAEKAVKDIILVVEDSVDMRNYIRSSLEPQYQVVEALDGRDGIEKASQIIPDLIISDIMMPETDGYELCRVLKNNRDTSHIPIILLTAKASEENILQGLELGADDYVTKPFSTQLLCARIKNLVDLRRHLQLNMEREMTQKPVKTSVSNIDKEFVKDLLEVINKNISDPEFNVEELCKRLYMGRTTLYRKILALTGEPPTEFIRSYRLKRGAELLKKGMGSVLEVAFEVGFSSANYFTKCFKKKFHQLPSSFQASEAESS